MTKRRRSLCALDRMRLKNKAGRPFAPPAPALTAPLDSAFAYYNVIHMEEVLTLRLPKGSRRRLTQLARRKRQNLSQYVRHAIESQLWVDALDETAVLAAPKGSALGLKTDDDVFRLFS